MIENNKIIEKQTELLGQQFQSPWVSVKDALPPTDEKVLICVRKVWPSNAVINPKDYSIELSQRIGHVSKAEKRYVDKHGFPNHGYKEFDVLYWMPIPDFPEEDV